MVKYSILGTAGHIDHGKSSLVKALTGTDPDRLAEEKKRGITIELGYAHLQWDDLLLGVVDVPGHEKFVKTMAAGTVGIDFVLMVIAADEGVMPQTREHTEIGQYLGISEGIIALTKIDLVDEEWIEAVEEEIREELGGTFLEGAPIVRVSSKTGEGLDRLRELLHQYGLRVQRRSFDRHARIATDRLFELKGIGLIAAGTLLSGQLKVGDNIEFIPSKKRGKIRSLQNHNRSVERVEAGQRVALNIGGIERKELSRGEWLVPAGKFEPTFQLEVELHLSPHYPKPFPHRGPALLMLGTEQFNCRVHLHTPRPLPPGERALARLLLEGPSFALPGDRFILRGFQRLPRRGTTIAGGTVIDPYPVKKKLSRREVEFLSSVSPFSEESVVEYLIWKRGEVGSDLKTLEGETGILPEVLRILLETLVGRGRVVRGGGEAELFIHRESLDRLKGRILSEVREFHAKNPIQPGITLKILEDHFGPWSGVAVGELVREEKLKLRGEVVSEFSFRVQLRGEESQLLERIASIYRTAGLQPPRESELYRELALPKAKVRPLLQHLIREGVLVRVSDEFLFYAEAVENLKKRVYEFLLKNGEMRLSDFRGLAENISRKFLIPLAEYFDKTGLTVRRGEVRVLGEK